MTALEQTEDRTRTAVLVQTAVQTAGKALSGLTNNIQ